MNFRLLLNQYLKISVILMSLVACNVYAQNTILVFGDSLSAGYGIDVNKGWVKLLHQKLQLEQYDYQVVNASISGETTSGGLARIAQQLNSTKPSIVIIELGANDGLRGLSIKEMQENLSAIILQSQNNHAKVLLLGMKIPPNYGMFYTKRFEQTYEKLANEHNVGLVPFFLEGVAGDATLNQPDGIHPTAAAQPQILNTIWPILTPILKLNGK
jgi:acyl-CoA thioesterase I